MAVALVKYGADFSIKNAQDELPLDLAPDKEVRKSFDDSDSGPGPGPGFVSEMLFLFAQIRVPVTTSAAVE